MTKDQSKISNAQHEIKQAAKTLGVHPIVVHYAKYFTGSNDRKVIYDWVENRRGMDIVINVPKKEGVAEKKPKMIGTFTDVSGADLPPVDWRKALKDTKKSQVLICNTCNTQFAACSSMHIDQDWNKEVYKYTRYGKARIENVDRCDLDKPLNDCCGDLHP